MILVGVDAYYSDGLELRMPSQSAWKIWRMVKTLKKEPVEATFLHIYRGNEDSAFKGGLLECLRRWYPTAMPQFQRDGRIFLYILSVFYLYFSRQNRMVPMHIECLIHHIYINMYLFNEIYIYICIQLSNFYLAKDSTKSIKKFKIDTCWQGFLKNLKQVLIWSLLSFWWNNCFLLVVFPFKIFKESLSTSMDLKLFNTFGRIFG